MDANGNMFTAHEARAAEMQATADETRILANALRPIGQLTERELLEEQTYWLRTAGKALKELQSGGMGKMLLGSLGAPRR